MKRRVSDGRHAVSGRWLPSALGVCVIVALMMIAAPSSGAPGDPVPGDEQLHNQDWPDYAIGQITSKATQSTKASRAKQVIEVTPARPIYTYVLGVLYNTPAENPTSYASGCVRGRPCVPDPFEQPACADPADPTTQRRGQLRLYKAWPVGGISADGKATRLDVGEVTTVPVKMVAFGSIPTTASITLRASEASGKVKPWDIAVYLATSDGCGNGPANKQTTFLRGEVDITISDLKVDGVPVDVGPSCRTTRPSSLVLWGEGQPTEGGYAPGTGGALGAFKGLHPGTLGPLPAPYFRDLSGITIPASSGITIAPFVGCKNGADDVSSLVTAMASGPDNPVRVQQSGPFGPQSGKLDLADWEACDEISGFCPPPVPDTPEEPPFVCEKFCLSRND